MDKNELAALFRELIGLDNVVGVGRGYKLVRGESTGQEAALVLVNRKYPRGDLRRAQLVPRRIMGMATDIIEVGGYSFY